MKRIFEQVPGVALVLIPLMAFILWIVLNAHFGMQRCKVIQWRRDAEDHSVITNFMEKGIDPDYYYTVRVEVGWIRERRYIGWLTEGIFNSQKDAEAAAKLYMSNPVPYQVINTITVKDSH